MAFNSSEDGLVAIPYADPGQIEELFELGAEDGEDSTDFVLLGEEGSQEPDAPQVLYVYTEDLYARIQEVLEGNRKIGTQITAVQNGFKVSPDARSLSSFTLPTDPSQFEATVSGWRADV